MKHTTKPARGVCTATNCPVCEVAPVELAALAAVVTHLECPDYTIVAMDRDGTVQFVVRADSRHPARCVILRFPGPTDAIEWLDSTRAAFMNVLGDAS